MKVLYKNTCFAYDDPAAPMDFGGLAAYKGRKLASRLTTPSTLKS